MTLNSFCFVVYFAVLFVVLSILQLICNRAKKLRKKCAKIVVHTKERKSPNLIVNLPHHQHY